MNPYAEIDRWDQLFKGRYPKQPWIIMEARTDKRMAMLNKKTTYKGNRSFARYLRRRDVWRT